MPLLDHNLVMNSCSFPTAHQTTEIYTLSLHDALPISRIADHGEALGQTLLEREIVERGNEFAFGEIARRAENHRSEEHTSELQSRFDLVCRLLLENKNQLKLTRKRMEHELLRVLILQI